jgi:8-oxo-dGTP diphosphatase
MEKSPQVGAAAIIRNAQGELLLGLRKSVHAHGTWGFPGGHVEFMETPEQGVIREVKEETGLDVLSVHKAGYTNDFYPLESKHVVTLFFEVEIQGQPKACEPHKCEEWKWFSPDHFPDNLMPSIYRLMEQGYHF